MTGGDSLIIEAIVHRSKGSVILDPGFIVSLAGTIFSAISLFLVFRINSKVIKALNQRQKREFHDSLIRHSQRIREIKPDIQFDQALSLAWDISFEFSKVSESMPKLVLASLKITERQKILTDHIGNIEKLRPIGGFSQENETVFNGCMQGFYVINGELAAIIGKLESAEELYG